MTELHYRVVNQSPRLMVPTVSALERFHCIVDSHKPYHVMRHESEPCL